MAENEYVNKVVYGNDTLIDLTSDSVTANDLLSGVTAHDRSGAPITGTVTTAPLYNDLDKSTTGYALDATQGKVLKDSIDVIEIYSSDSTLANFYNSIKDIPVSHGAFIYLAKSALVSLLTNAKLDNICFGTIFFVNKTNGTYEFDVRRPNNGDRYAWRISGFTSGSATITIGSVYKYTGTAV